MVVVCCTMATLISSPHPLVIAICGGMYKISCISKSGNKSCIGLLRFWCYSLCTVQFLLCDVGYILHSLGISGISPENKTSCHESPVYGYFNSSFFQVVENFSKHYLHMPAINEELNMQLLYIGTWDSTEKCFSSSTHSVEYTVRQIPTCPSRWLVTSLLNIFNFPFIFMSFFFLQHICSFLKSLNILCCFTH